MASFKYHLTYNGKFSKDTYIEYFDPEKINNYSGGTEENDSSDNKCTEALKTLKEALNKIPEDKKDCEQIVSKLYGMLSDEPCKPNCNPCGNQKESENLYFAEEYKNAIAIIKEIVKDWQCNSTNTDLCERMKCQWDNLPKNNRVLFHGQRGSGKTSVTMSVAKSIEGHLVDCTKFKVLPIINPGYFDQDTNILKTVISNMFEMAKCIIKNECDFQQNEYEDLLKQFEEVYRLLGNIESPNKEKHTLESLNEISKASGMREEMQKLINKFLKILPCHADCLVLVIDDVDMSVAYAATMLEQIKKFLELDNLLILISANLEQLHNEMREHYSKAFKETLKDKNQSLSIDVEDLASKYLLKLFPTSRRINVERPISELLQTKLSIPKKEGNLQKVVLSLIWEKTRLLFIPKDAQTTLHPIIPTNLRELAQLIELLVGMGNVECNPDKGKLFKDYLAYNSCRKNLGTFKHYFLNIWVPTHLSVDEEQVFRNIPSDITEINKHLINSINTIGTKNKKRLMSREVGLDMIERNADNVDIDRDIYTMVSPNDPRFVKANKISDIFNQPSNYSYGDLLLMIDKYETYFESEEDRRFSNAIKIYYSILLFETMFFKSTDVKYDKDGFDDAKNQGKDVVPIQKLIGGTVYYPNYFEIITSKYFIQKGPSYDAKRAFYHKVLAEKMESVGNNYPLFSVLYYGDVRPDRYDPTHIYDTTYEKNSNVDNKRYVTFDMLSILNNMLNPWHTVYRAYEFLYGKKIKEVESEIQQIEKEIKKLTSVPGDSNGDIIKEKKIRMEMLKKILRWPKGLDQWNEICSIDGVEATPNSILPFYSVDIMLRYLKTSYEDQSIQSQIDESKRDKANYGRLELIEKEIKKILKNLLSNKSVDVQGECGKINDLKGQVSDNEAAISPELSSTISIIETIHSAYSVLTIDGPKASDWFLSEKISVADRYRDFCIATILSNYRGSKKDLDMMIKGLKKYNTISEMYRYLVEQLWGNVATEELIRQEIKKVIRNNNVVSNYYGKLFYHTKDMLKSITLDNDKDKLVSLYNSLYEEGKKVFILEESKEKTKNNKTNA